jgi:HD-like signal output (HDOD) protein
MTSEKLHELQELLKKAQLPALPQSAAQLLELSRNPENGPQEYTVPICADVGMTTQVLRFVNSAYFGFNSKITSIPQALALVGVRTIKNYVIWNAVFTLMPNPKCGPFQLKKLWQDSLRRGILAKCLAQHIRTVDPDDIFVCALLQDMAIPLLAKINPMIYAQLLERRGEEQIRLSHLEREVFGWDHAEAGELLAEKWGFSEYFRETIGRHASISPADFASREIPKNELVALTSYLPSVFDVSWSEKEKFLEGYEKLLGPTPPTPEKIFEEVDETFCDLSAITHLGKVSRTLKSVFQESFQTSGA